MAHPQREDPTPRPRSRSSPARFTVGTKRSLAGEGRAQRHLVERSGRAEAGPGRETPDGVRRGRGSRYTDVIAEESLPAGRGGVGQISRATEPALPADGDAIVGRGHVAHGHPRADILASAIDDEDRAAVRGDPRREAVAGLTWHAHLHRAEWPPRRSPVRRDAHDDVVEPVGTPPGAIPCAVDAGLRSPQRAPPGMLRKFRFP